MRELDRILDEETEASELGRDAEPTAAAKVSRPNRNKSKVFSVRLSESEMAALQETADKANLAASTMARSLIVSQLTETPTPAALRAAVADELTKQMEPVQRKLDEMSKALAESGHGATG
jgi:hypothetical protein